MTIAIDTCLDKQSVEVLQLINTLSSYNILELEDQAVFFKDYTHQLNPPTEIEERNSILGNMTLFDLDNYTLNQQVDATEKISRTGRGKLPSNYTLMITQEKQSSSGFPIGLSNEIGSFTAPDGQYFAPDSNIESDGTNGSSAPSANWDDRFIDHKD